MHEGLITRQNKSTVAGHDQHVRQIVVPKEVKVQVLTLAHDAVMAGHLGVKKTLDRIPSCFYWPGIHEDVQRFCFNVSTFLFHVTYVSGPLLKGR